VWLLFLTKTVLNFVPAKKFRMSIEKLLCEANQNPESPKSLQLRCENCFKSWAKKSSSKYKSNSCCIIEKHHTWIKAPSVESIFCHSAIFTSPRSGLFLCIKKNSEQKLSLYIWDRRLGLIGICVPVQ
jgi:uncharacterized metal-binding protein